MAYVFSHRRVIPLLALLAAVFTAAAGCGDDSGGNQNDIDGSPTGCGNGITDPGEECDEGINNSDTTPDACRTDCRRAGCGDDVADSDEVCDGADLKLYACEDLGYTTGTLTCAQDCTFDETGCTTCGNGLVESNEDCDATNLDNQTCVTLGHEGGVLQCGADCAFDESECYDCGNGTCDPLETLGSCSADCAMEAVSAGPYHTCAMLNNGKIWCWGKNDGGQLGNGTNVDANTPQGPVGTLTAVSVATGGMYSTGHTCAALSDGTAACWGYNENGQLGDDSYVQSNVPVAVSGLSNAVQVAAGSYHSCAVLDDGTVRCWGNGGMGQLGDGTTSSSTVPVQVTGIAGALQVAAGEGHTCAVLSGGTVHCWGSNSNGQLGNGTTGGTSNVPVQVSSLGNAVAVSAGDYHACAVTSSGEAWCWGAGPQGQLGNGQTTGSNTPVEVQYVGSQADIALVVGISGGSAHTCSIHSSNKVFCWGDNAFGQLGLNSTQDQSTGWSTTDLQSMVSVSAGWRHTCAVMLDGTLRCWGDNTEGELGTGNNNQSLVPVAVIGL